MNNNGNKNKEKEELLLKFSRLAVDDKNTERKNISINGNVVETNTINEKDNQDNKPIQKSTEVKDEK